MTERESGREGCAGAQHGSEAVDLRRRVERFARLRSAHRALPAGARSIEETSAREGRADALRELLGSLAARLPEDGGAVEDALRDAIDRADAALDAMESDLLESFDALDFKALRASIPRAAQTYRHEVVALLDVLLEEREGLLDRLSKVEYLVTILSTEEVDGRRNVVHDPATLTPYLASFRSPDESGSAETIAVEIYQAAALDGDGEGEALFESLQRVRHRKDSIGLARLTPDVLRAVVTYNARMFNRIEASTDSSRQADALIAEMLCGSADAAELRSSLALADVGSGPAAEEVSTPQPDDDPEEPPEAKSAGSGVSVLDSPGVANLVDGLRRRLKGLPVGSCSSERVALALDQDRLGELEREAIRSTAPSEEEVLVARTALIGLMLRDLGAVRSELESLGIDLEDLSRHWPLELNERLGRIVSQRLADARELERASRLSSIKTAYLLAPLAALKDGRRQAAAGSGTAAETGVTWSPARTDSPASDRATARAGGAHRREPQRPGRMAEAIAWRPSRAWVAMAPLAAVLVLVAFLLLRTEPTSVAHLDDAALHQTSSWIESAYRSDHGRGGLLIGRMRDGYLRLPDAGRLEAARSLADRLRGQGIRDAMLYDAKGRLVVHFASGVLRRPGA